MSSKVTTLVVLGGAAAAFAAFAAAKNPDQVTAVTNKVKDRATDPNGLVQKGKTAVVSRASGLATAGKARLGRDTDAVVTSTVSATSEPAATDHHVPPAFGQQL